MLNNLFSIINFVKIFFYNCRDLSYSVIVCKHINLRTSNAYNSSNVISLKINNMINIGK